MFTNVYQKSKKIHTYYECKNCDYITSSNKDYKKHLNTIKHFKRQNVYQNVDQILTNIDPIISKSEDTKCNDLNTDDLNTNNTNNTINQKKFICICGNSYSYKQSLYVHKKKCKKINIKEEQNNSENLDYKELFLEVIKQNNLLQNTISELIPKVGNNNNSNNNINIFNNISFLNHKCKDAISIDEFIGSIDFQVKNLLKTGEKGLPTGLSSIFIEHYNNLPLIKRPLWCSDKKRKKLFIKEDKWCEDVNQEKTKEAIKTLAFKQTKNIKKYISENPDFMSNDKKTKDYLNILKETTSEIDNEKQNIIINNLLDNIHLNDETKQIIENTL